MRLLSHGISQHGNEVESLFMQRISVMETNCAIQWIVIHLVDNVIHLLNNWGVESQEFYGNTVINMFIHGRLSFKLK